MYEPQAALLGLTEDNLTPAEEETQGGKFRDGTWIEEALRSALLSERHKSGVAPVSGQGAAEGLFLVPLGFSRPYSENFTREVLFPCEH